jgi:hypothetical protein
MRRMEKKVKRGDFVRKKRNHYQSGEVVRVCKDKVFVDMYASLCGLKSLGICECSVSEVEVVED